MMEKRGLIFLIEGTDGSGKNTQSKRLFEKLNLKGFPSEIMSFPSYDTPMGRIIGQCYLGKPGLGEGDLAWFGDADSVDPVIASLLYATNRKADEKKMRRILDSGKNLILDRYVESNMGHQGGKETNPKKREELINFIEELEYGHLKLPRPDLTIFLYMPYDYALKLREGRLETDGHESNKGHLMRAEETYLHLAKKYNWKRIDCVSSSGNIRGIEEIFNEVYKHVTDVITNENL